jgi:hypothetical protein
VGLPGARYSLPRAPTLPRAGWPLTWLAPAILAGAGRPSTWLWGAGQPLLSRSQERPRSGHFYLAGKRTFLFSFDMTCRPGNRGTPAPVKERALRLVRELYGDFGPTLAAEKLGELHDLSGPGRRSATGCEPAACGPRARTERRWPISHVPSGGLRRARPDRRLRAPLVRGPPPLLLAPGLRRRRHGNRVARKRSASPPVSALIRRWTGLR